MKLKDGAVLSGLHPSMRMALITAQKVYERHGRELVVTSGLDGTHSAGSWHYYGRAIDLRTSYFDEDQKESVYLDLKRALGDRYRVFLEATHIHVDYPEV